jgi:hypothetical protein
VKTLKKVDDTVQKPPIPPPQSTNEKVKIVDMDWYFD